MTPAYSYPPFALMVALARCLGVHEYLARTKYLNSRKIATDFSSRLIIHTFTGLRSTDFEQSSRVFRERAHAKHPSWDTHKKKIFWIVEKVLSDPCYSLLVWEWVAKNFTGSRTRTGIFKFVTSNFQVDSGLHLTSSGRILHIYPHPSWFPIIPFSPVMSGWQPAVKIFPPTTLKR